ncbi:formate dehydrogenase accessory sulfurtransferase FdhD [Massilia sp. BJB1822]|uniref:formate dehydrogenase accessory sulfurtransferase FdhD n=1 Tax=Massilia sp. BJB1822 TaxID=2744470 RepID=UPI0015936109|nr:formate dehydrogenase accessory sulfurtransferase FdhD [Massilia sp. BJB1822]NVE00658.1 formate dehydrogenase accessory sulfurtransferase FdhD [Massilia sp. BJB1822]
MEDNTQERVGYQRRPIIRHHDGVALPCTDLVAEEIPVAIVINGISHAVMMATPCDLASLAVGFALTESIVERVAEIYEVEAHQLQNAAEVQLEIAAERFMRMKERRRALAGRTGCGVCGIESLALLDLEPQLIAAVDLPDPIGPAIARAASELPGFQSLMHETGCVHAAAWCDQGGAVLRVFEDVGRHNALDKLVGSLCMDRGDMRAGFVFLSSRASYELVMKAARVGIPMLATISAPTTLAIDIARQAGLKLVSFCRADGFVDYTAAIYSSRGGA